MNEKETTKVNQEQETQVTKIDDLPVSQSEQDEVKGGTEAQYKATPKLFLYVADGEH